MWLIQPIFLLASCLVTWGRVSDVDQSEQSLDKVWREWDNLSKNIQEEGTYMLESRAQDAVDQFNRQLRDVSHTTMEALWEFDTNITDQTSNAYTTASLAEAQWRAEQLDDLTRYSYFENYDSPELVRMLKVIQVSGAEPNPRNDHDLRRRIELGNELETIYSSAKFNGHPLDPDLNNIMETSRDPDELLEAWLGWRSVSGSQMRSQFDEFVGLLNQGATENGFSDYGEFLRLANYESRDMSAEYQGPVTRTIGSTGDIEGVVDDLWEELKPLYEQLHAYVRRKLSDHYPTLNIDPEHGTIPAHILGNMWAQEWNLIYDLVVPFGDEEPIDVTSEMVAQGYTARQMMETAEQFFISIGLEPMTDTFWEKSVFVYPQDDRDMVCHASAEDFFADDDFRIKMCAEVTQEYLHTMHHEMGHIEYFMAYKDQPTMYRKGGNSGFHEAVGDTISLSVNTPKHLHTIGLLQSDSTNERQTINFLLKIALEKVAFLPFGLMIDKYRWDIYRGIITNANYNQKWWQYRKKYQGLSPPVERSEDDFDAGAKYHVAGNVPYIRYFLSFILQFQFHEALCSAAGQGDLPLHECDIYGSTDAGNLLRSALQLGGSKYWPEVLDLFTGTRHIDPTSIQRYFQPLTEWLTEQNQGHNVGWR